LNGQRDNMGILEYFFTIMQKIKVPPIEYYRILYVDLLTTSKVVNCS